MTVVNAVAVEVVLEARAECSDAEAARAALSDALLAARAPAHVGVGPRGSRVTRPSAGAPAEASPPWTVTVKVTSDSARAGRATSAEAIIADDAGAVVAQRTLTDRSARTCLSLAKAVGTWASLVLDAEMNRAKDDVGDVGGVAPFAREVPSGSSNIGVMDAAPFHDSPLPSGGEGSRPGARHSVELGVMVYLRNGMAATGGMAGLAPFVTVELSPEWVLRPGLFFGRSTERVPVSATQADRLSHLGGRLDFCRRIPGNYVERRGVEADLCAGVEGGVVTGDRSSGQSPARLGVGPSLNLRGELGAGLALEVRSLIGANVLAFAPQSPLVFASAELGMSVRLP